MPLFTFTTAMADDEPPNPFGVKLKKRGPPRKDGEMSAAEKEIAAARSLH